MNPMDLLFGHVRNAIMNQASPNTPGPAFDPTSLLNQIGGIFGQQAPNIGHQFGGYDHSQHYGGEYGHVLSSDQDPYGDPDAFGGQQVSQQYGNILSSDQDPLGDPDAPGGGRFGRILSSNQDPYGDPDAR